MSHENELRPLFGANVDPSAAAAENARRVAEAADEGGLDLITIQDHPYHTGFLDTWTLLTFLGSRTRRVHLGTNVANLPLRPPVMLAKAAASLDLLTGGRVLLGLGAGANWGGIHALGGPRREASSAVEAFEEALQIIRLFWEADEGQTVSFEGEHYRLSDARTGPKPRRRIPLWTGAHGPRMLRLTGRMADGIWISTRYVPPWRVPEKMGYVDEGARSAGRSPRDVRHGYSLMGLLELDRAGTPRVKNPREGMIVGPPQHWVETILGFYRDLGMNAFVFWPFMGDALPQVQAFAETVVPQVKRELGL